MSGHVWVLLDLSRPIRAKVKKNAVFPRFLRLSSRKRAEGFVWILSGFAAITELLEQFEYKRSLGPAPLAVTNRRPQVEKGHAALAFD
jgi:hypothetical protein